MEIFVSKLFKEGFNKLPKNIQVLAEKKIEMFSKDPRHPSLRIKKMAGVKNIWEGRINDNYRFTFQIGDGAYLLRRIGAHDILKKEK